MKSLVISLCLGFVLSSTLKFSPHEWNKLILTHHWPHTFCSMEQCKTNFSYWTLHGFWPNSGMGCNSTWHFNASLIKDLMPEMKTYWPDLLHPASTAFWKHEWFKHGTCAAKSEDLNTQHKYFSKALELYHKLDLDGVLKKCQILPAENPYKLDDLEKCITDVYKVTPKIQCVPKGQEEQILGQIEVCVDKQFQLVDCEKASKLLWSRDNEDLLFAHIRHSGFTVCDPSVPIYYPMADTL
ncbi:ribonuclease T2 [Brachyhypopomus gauderio]|uniref:ribonuclease T2 n=1 Tax=Brachyhypopomus gauderio TaxID=698409 RepID=UPI00404382E7